MRKKDLELKLQELEDFREPVAELEQYVTPAPVAARLLWQAYMKGDIEEKKVYDLGCGTGILSVGAKLLGASDAIAVDADSQALEIARRNAEKAGVTIETRRVDIEDLEGEADTVVQNPPFGSQKKGNDRPFMIKALEIAPVVYSIHMAETDQFIRDFVDSHKGRVTHCTETQMTLPKSMPWHEKEMERIRVNIYRFERK